MARRPPNRDEDIRSRVDEDKLLDLYKDVDKAFEAQRDRADEIKDNWDMYHCRLNDKQFYNGTSQFALPFVHDAVEARVTRFVNQIFPMSGRYIEVTTNEADPPQATQSLLEGYVRKAKLRTKVAPTLVRNGDLEGTYCVALSWKEIKRKVVTRIKKQPTTDGLENPAAEPVDDFQEEEITDRGPDVEVIADADWTLLPATSETIEDAIENGGSMTLIRRWSKGKVKKLIEDGEIDKDEGEDLIEAMSNAAKTDTGVDQAKANLDSAGIKERGKVAQVYETWTKLKVKAGKDKDFLLCRVYFGGEKRILGVKRCPYWNDRVPILAGAQRKVTGSFKAQPLVKQVAPLQILANDTINEAADTSHFSAMPIVMTDPLKNPRVDTMSLGLAAVWETSPNDTQLVQFPELWKDGLDRAMAIQGQIFQTLGVNPSMIPQNTGGPNKKRNQAEMATEQQVDLLTTADSVTILEELIFTPMVQWFAEADHQFRDEAETVEMYGEMGLRANMEMVEPLQLNERFSFKWYGVEAARNAAQMQQQISWVNTIKEIPPQLYEGYELKLGPMIVAGTENVFGPRLGALTFRKKTMISVDPMVENEMLLHGFDVEVHPGDDDQMHLQAHMLLIPGGDAHGMAKLHIAKHMQQLQAKAMQQQGGAPGQPMPPGAGGPQQPGDQAGGPRPGAMANAPAGPQQPPGAIHKDQLPAAGAVVMPRPKAVV